jgi:hypothetical protein
MGLGFDGRDFARQFKRESVHHALPGECRAVQGLASNQALRLRPLERGIQYLSLLRFTTVRSLGMPPMFLLYAQPAKN